MDRPQLRRWLTAYERAWRSPGTAALAELFAERATYRTAPFERPHVGLGAIGRLWEAERTGPDESFTIDSEIVAVEGGTGVARVEVRYGEPITRLYRDLWIVTLDAHGLCTAFEEWPFWPAGSDGQTAHAAPP